MKTVTKLDELRAARKELAAPVGLVPTMGYLHAGHLSLVQRACAENAAVIATIFVNPTQFGPEEDLQTYPRDTEGDLAKFAAAGVDLVWMPTQEIMYPAGFQTEVRLKSAARVLEGAYRPGHFEGVATVVAKLFNATQPDRAYFGQKDAQQAVVIRRMALDLNFPLEVVICPTVREADGLALSSRNAYLDPAQRQAATVLYRALQAAKMAYENGERHGERLRARMAETIGREPLAEMQYVSCADPLTLQELEEVEQDMLLSMAVFVGKTRLIDNFLLQGRTWLEGEIRNT